MIPAPLVVSAREAVIAPLAAAARMFPDLPPTPFDPASLNLSQRDAVLAAAIHQTVLDRWITLEFLLDQFLRQPSRNLEPPLRAVLLSGAAQLLFLSHSAPYAVVDESVELARRLVRPGAAGLVNAVLRRIAELLKARHEGEPWTPDVDALPFDGGWIELSGPCLPDPDTPAKHLSVATSHPPALVKSWLDAFGEETTRGLCLHSLTRPPTIVAVEAGFDLEAHRAAGRALQSHDREGFLLWQDGREALRSFLSEHPARRVQDPTAAAAIADARDLKPARILDYCAGRGTKTRQLLSALPPARVYATDRDSDRLDELTASIRDQPRLTVVPMTHLPAMLPKSGVDLLVLDVPCSNTGVLARRLEARYRFSDRSIESLVRLQREILRAAMPLVKPGGHVLYTTCSVDERENHRQVESVKVEYRATLLREQLTLPAGRGATYHDGGYFALMRTGD